MASCWRNVLKMGHCAPTVMQTLLEQHARPDSEMVRCAGGLPGIGGGRECGGVSSPLMAFGLFHGSDRADGGALRAIAFGQDHLRQFEALHGSVMCRDIGAKGMRACLSAILSSPALFEQVASQAQHLADALPPQRQQAYQTLLTTLEQRQFHCAHRVLDEMRDLIVVTDDMRRASWLFIGGTALSGRTCGALTAGIMAMNAKLGGIEDSTWRTLRMGITMVFSVERALRDEMNAFNPAIRRACTLAQWFEGQFGSTSCAELTGADLGSPRAVDAFCSERLERCVALTARVASEVRQMLRAG